MTNMDYNFSSKCYCCTTISEESLEQSSDWRDGKENEVDYDSTLGVQGTPLPLDIKLLSGGYRSTVGYYGANYTASVSRD